MEQSFSRPCHQMNGWSKRKYDLNSSIVPRGTSFHRTVELEAEVTQSPAQIVFGGDGLRLKHSWRWIGSIRGF